MANTKKKRKMKKSVRRTLGALFLASSLVVAAIPTDGFRTGAAPESVSISNYKSDWNWEKQFNTGSYTSKIPLVPADCDDIYGDSTGKFRFAWIRDTAVDGKYVAVLLQYGGGRSESGTLHIPDTVSAFAQYSVTAGGQGYAAISESREALYYMSTKYELVTQEVPVLDLENKPTGEVQTYFRSYLEPDFTICGRDDTTWQPTKDTTFPAYLQRNFYYRVDMSVSSGDPNYVCEGTLKNPDGTLNSSFTNTLDSAPLVFKGRDGFFYKRVGEDQLHQWIYNQEVRYIGNQFLKETQNTGSELGANGTVELVKDYEIAEATANEEPDNGVFAGDKTGNITTLTVGNQLQGVGNYAFYGCSLQTIEFGDGLREIGHDAFAKCGNLRTVSIPFNSNLSFISDCAFAYSGLYSFVVPRTVSKIYDSAFEGCASLTSINLTGEGQGTTVVDGVVLAQQVNLDEIGCSVFKDCVSLTEVTLPESLATRKIHLDNFSGCTSLAHIKVQHDKTDFIPHGAAGDADYYSIEKFKSEVSVSPQIYFEASSLSNTHAFTRGNAISFRYTDEDKQYEIIESGEDVNNAKVDIVFQVTEDAADEKDRNALYCDTGGAVEVEIPDRIGPIPIKSIKANGFAGNCALQKIRIPRFVTSIGDNAFLGCHKLRHVIFDDATVLTSIGSNAFATQTQTATGHKGYCKDPSISDAPSLTFTGAITRMVNGAEVVTEPFAWAMAPNIINNKQQSPTYVTYYSGWPENLEIQYIQGDGATLVKLPVLEYLNEYTEDRYPYIDEEYEKLAGGAYAAYTSYMSNVGPEPTTGQWEIINASLEPEIPVGVQAIKDGLFAGTTVSGGNPPSSARKLVIKGLDVIEGPVYVTNPAGEHVISDGTGDFYGCPNLEKVEIYSNASIEDYAFGNCSRLETVYINGDNERIGSHAFKNCTLLQNVALPALPGRTLADGTREEGLGECPFCDCTQLTTVTFLSDDCYQCSNSIIYTSDGKKLVECLPGRRDDISSGTDPNLANVTSLAEGAFASSPLVVVDLSGSAIGSVPENAFAYTDNLYKVSLPVSCDDVQSRAFYKSALQHLCFKVKNATISPTAFEGTTNPLKLHCIRLEEGEKSNIKNFADGNGLDFADDEEPVINWYITFQVADSLGADGKFVWSDIGEPWQGTNINDLIYPDADKVPIPDGYQWTKDDWEKYVEYGTGAYLYITYRANYRSPDTYTVTFVDSSERNYVQIGSPLTGIPYGASVRHQAPTRNANGTEIVNWGYPDGGSLDNVTKSFRAVAEYKTYETDLEEGYARAYYHNWDEKLSVYTYVDVKIGEMAPPIGKPTTIVPGCTFREWYPDPAATVVTGTVHFYAQYDDIAGGGEGPGGSGSGGSGGSDDSGSGGSGSGGSGGSEGPGGSGSTGPTYTLTVVKGSGTGSYAAGTHVVVVADNPASGLEFSGWTVYPASTVTSDKTQSAMMVTMPKTDVMVTANYKKSASGSSNTASGGNAVKPGTVSSKGTTVVIDKNGLSNTGVVSATVHGSSDNFTIKVSESSSASEAVLKALIAEYGNDLSSIKYFPMDISLYDAAGKTKIKDTSGLSISITLPLPDSLTGYAGNNKVAGVVNERLDKLGTKFTTINGVACVTFTAEHFSPYVIYTNTNTLAETVRPDNTPKTGDGIHPKWFLSIGLACISVILFMKRDKKTLQKVKAS